MKKSQVTIFIILGLLILIIIGIIINFEVKKPKKVENKSINIETPESIFIKSESEECLNLLVDEALLKIQNQGLIKPKRYIASNKIIIGFLYYEGEKNIITKKDLEKSISNYVTEKINECLKSKDINLIEEKKPEIVVTLFENEINAKLKYEENIIYQGKKYTINQIYIKKETNILELINTANKIIESINEDEWLNLDVIKNEKFNISVIKLEPDTWIYDIKYEEQKEITRYRFGVKY